MSWSIEVSGNKAGVAKKAAEQLDKIATSYEGKEEAKDVAAAKERILSTLEALELGPDPYGNEWNGVTVKASGSHSTGAKGVWSSSMQIAISRTSLAIG
jgi:hypothetical protein